MERRLETLQHQLQSTVNNLWCQTLSNEIHRLSSALSHRLPIYRTELTRDQLVFSIRKVQELNLNTRAHELYRRAMLNYLVLIAIHTQKYVCEQFLAHVQELRKHWNYWLKHEENRSWPILEQFKGVFWIDAERDDIRLSEKTKFLQGQDALFSSIIGRLAYNINGLEQQDEQIHLDQLMQSTNDLSKILYEERAVNYHRDSDLLDVLECYFQILNTFDDLKVRWIDSLHLYHRPSHFKRYFPYYLCFGAAGLYAFYRIYSNRTAINNYISTTFDSLKFFIHEHLVLPLKTIYVSTFESRASQSSFENSQLNYEHSKKILEEMLIDYGKQHAQTLSDIEQITVEEFLGKLTERANNEDMNIVMKNYQRELDQPIRSAFVGDLIKGILIQVQKVKVDGEGLIIQIDQLMKQNQINFSLLATIPTILLFTFLTMSTKNLITGRILKQRTFDLTTLRQQILRKLRQIEHVLIFNSESPALKLSSAHLFTIERVEENGNGDARKRSMSESTYGEFLSLIYELKFFSNQLRSKRMLSDEFNDDIHFLTYAQFTIEQKLLFIHQIFHSYSFLTHL